jgi:hypothetical protein
MASCEWGGEALLVAVVILMNIASLALYCPWPSLAAIADPRKMVLSVSLVHLSQRCILPPRWHVAWPQHTWLIPVQILSLLVVEDAALSLLSRALTSRVVARALRYPSRCDVADVYQTPFSWWSPGGFRAPGSTGSASASSAASLASSAAAAVAAFALVRPRGWLSVAAFVAARLLETALTSSSTAGAGGVEEAAHPLTPPATCPEADRKLNQRRMPPATASAPPGAANATTPPYTHAHAYAHRCVLPPLREACGHVQAAVQRLHKDPSHATVLAAAVAFAVRSRPDPDSPPRDPTWLVHALFANAAAMVAEKRAVPARRALWGAGLLMLLPAQSRLLAPQCW